jgi:predicted transcriptional regulator YheO
MNFLNKVEDAYEDKVDMMMNEMTLKQYQDVINTISVCLSRSNDIITSVLKDDTLANILIVNNDNSNTTVNNTLKLQTPESRDKVLKVVDGIISKINSVESGGSSNE